MEEPKKETLQEPENGEELETSENELEESAESVTETSGEDDKRKEQLSRSHMLWVLAGCYLLYTGYKLCSNVIKGVDGATPVFFLAGAGFIAVAAFLLYRGIKGVFQDDKVKKLQESAKAQAEQEKKAEELKRSQEAQDRKMSISQRANLVQRVNEEEDEDETNI